MPIAHALLRFVDDELAHAPAMIERTLAGTVRLLHATDREPMPAAERAKSIGSVEALRSHGTAYQNAFVDALRAGVLEVLREQQGLPNLADALGTGSATGSGLALIDEARASIDIEISRAIALIDSTTEWELRALQRYTSTLTGQTRVSAESNPFRPQVYAGALWQAACAVTPTAAQRVAMLRTSSGVAADLLKSAWAAACARLESQGIEPGADGNLITINASATSGAPLPDIDAPSTMAGLLSSMPGGSSTVQVGVSNAAVPMGTAPASPAVDSLGPALEHALAQLYAPQSAGASPEALDAQRAALIDAADTSAARQVIELVSRVFDAVAADPRLPRTHAALIARLRASALRVALRDREVSGTTRHAVWRLLDRIGEIAQVVQAAPSPADARVGSLLALCDALVHQLSSSVAPDAGLYQSALRRLDALLSSQLQMQLHAAQPTVQWLTRAERRDLLTQRLEQRLTQQMETMHPTPGVRQFVSTTWSQVLAEAITRDGEQAESTQRYVKLVDHLLWSVQLPDHPTSRQRLVELLPTIIEPLRDGMALIDVPAAEQERLFTELMAIHAEALRPRSPAADRPLITPEEIVQAMREEVLLPASTGHGAFRDALIDLASTDTLPLEGTGEPATTAEAARERIAALVTGERLRLFIHGRWRRVQLMWRSDKSLYCLFVEDGPARTHSVSLRALERLVAAGLMRPLEARTLVQRALDAVMRDAGRYE